MPELPTTFGKYFLTEKLATGGMAEIYLGKIVGPGGFEKQLVIKQIHPKLSGQRHFVDLFVAEAKTLVTLAHGNIVPVYELGVVDDTYYIAMDYIDGPTLYRLTESLARRDARMEPAVAAWITARILEGLDYAHRKGEGVIHRDLSPRNVMLSRDGEVKLVDFGIAVTLGAAGEEDSAQSAPTGSFPYMSPEQVRKEQLTGQTDLFSVGVLAWEMLVGHRLFARNDPDATLRAVTEDEIPVPSAQRPEIPPKLDDIVLRALERDKTARWADAAEMLGALNKYLYSLDDTPGPRDVAALVARFCPPETRRLPTHADALEDLVPGVDVTKPRAEDTEPPAPPPAGPRTAVIPRDGAASPRGRNRAPTKRQQSFATHVQLAAIIERGTPLLPFDAIDDADTGHDAVAAPSVPKSVAELDSGPLTTAVAPKPAEVALKHDELSEPPTYRSLIFAGLGAIALLGGAYWVFLQGKDAVLEVDAPPKLDAPFYMGDVRMDDHDAEVPDAAVFDAGPIDAALPIDAGRSSPRDAGGSVVLDAAPRPVGTAKLTIGAHPWGEVYIDGVKQKARAPNAFTVAAGKHTIEVVFPEDDPPKKQKFTVELDPDQTKELFAEFQN